MTHTPPPFLIMALPRSRTFWLSRFLSYGGWHCGHDELPRMRGLDDVRAWLGTPGFGAAETAAAPWWRLALRLRSDLRVVVVRRPPEAVVESLVATGVKFDLVGLRRTIQRLDAKLDQVVERVPGAQEVSYQGLASEQVCADLFEHLLELPHDPRWWAGHDGANLQIDFAAQVRYQMANAPAIGALARVARQAEVGALRRRPLGAWSGLTIGQEPFGDFYADGEALLAEHTISVGEAPEAHLQRNIPLFRRLDAQGNLVTTVARCQGRPVGYLITIIAPSLENPEWREALATAFFAKPEFSGLGLKLQRAALEALRAAGVTKAVWRAGVRADGPRLGLLYERLGAKPLGTMWGLDLKDGV